MGHLAQRSSRVPQDRIGDELVCERQICAGGARLVHICQSRSDESESDQERGRMHLTVFPREKPLMCSSSLALKAEREFSKVALWPRRLRPGCGVIVADPLALLRLSLPNAGWRPVPRAWRSAASSLARVPFLLARGASLTHRLSMASLSFGATALTAEGRGLGIDAKE